jgi:hypothetical protein
VCRGAAFAICLLLLCINIPPTEYFTQVLSPFSPQCTPPYAPYIPHLQAVAEQDRFVIFVAAPEHDELYMSQNRRIEFYNRVVGAGHSLS